ncbi:MAG: hypothetical protein DLM53_12450 [Candidatus Eremiobacter antarcticus]|nr:hypothetical protein [Candidatus Eremiobacteraeota bacterium]MBC5808853.1 hypothetical protein [Candidatus Eremiobacteraeota bacterium]PZR60460.1 MAG: hypothetical protein DLM53_12450 [Candidatus Eremiobacter sp. RRmetagenome_bin22]
MSRFWADDLLQVIRRDFQGEHQGRNRVIIDERTFISIRLNGDFVQVQVGDLDSSPVDFQAFEFDSVTTSIDDAARSVQHSIRCLQSNSEVA